MVLRLCAPIEGTDAARLADCLGLDPAKYHAAAAAGASVRDAQEEALLASASALDDDARYKVKRCRKRLPCAFFFRSLMSSVQNVLRVSVGFCISLCFLALYKG